MKADIALRLAALVLVLVPASAVDLVRVRTLPVSDRSATSLVLLIYFILASVLWLISALGTIEPLGSPEAVL